jgi:hypothetical protein
MISPAGHPKKLGRTYNVNIAMGRKLIKEERALQEDDGMEEEKTKRSQFLTLSSYFLQREIFRELSSARR